MTARRPLVNVAGQLQELPAGDSIVGAPGGSASLTEVTLDFGAAPVWSKAFSFADAAVTTASKITMSPSGNPAASRSFDEAEMDGFLCAAACLADGTVSVAVNAHPGPVTGQYKFNYLLG